MEHLEHFRLARDPFRNDPQRRFYFESHQHRDAERRLMRGIRQGKGLAVLTGPVGSGKTTLVRHLLDQLDERRFEAGLLVLIQGAVDTDWLLRRMAQQIGIEEPSPERGQVLGQIYRRLVRLRQREQHAVILVDEAQMLGRREILVELRGLLNLEFDEQRLLSLVLAGLPELEGVLDLDAPLADRVEIRVELSSFDPRNAHAYLSHRIRCAGGDPGILEEGATRAIAYFSGGIPRRMNTLADNALFEAYLAERNRVVESDVERAARDLGWNAGSSAPAGLSEIEEAVVVEESEPAVALVIPDDHAEPELVVPVAAGSSPAAPMGVAPRAGTSRVVPEISPDSVPTGLEPEVEDTAPDLAPAEESDADAEVTAPEITLTEPAPPESDEAEPEAAGGGVPDEAGRERGEEGWEGLFSDAPPAPDLPRQVTEVLEAESPPDLASACADPSPAAPAGPESDDDSEVDALFGHLIDKG